MKERYMENLVNGIPHAREVAMVSCSCCSLNPEHSAWYTVGAS